MSVTRVGLGGPNAAYPGFSPKAAITNLDTRSKRASAVHLLHFSTLAPVLPDGTISRADRQHIAQFYSGIQADTVYMLTCDPGSYTWTGSDGQLDYGINAEVGAYTWSGVTLNTTIGSTASPGTYTWTGLDAILRRSPNTYLRLVNPQFVDAGVRISQATVGFSDSGVRISNPVLDT